LRIATFLSSLGGSPLQGGIERGLASMGHHVEPYDHRQGYDLVVIFQQVAHNPAYQFPARFPPVHQPIAFVDSSEAGYFTRLPDRAKEFAFSFTETVMRQSTKNYAEQVRLRDYLQGKSFPYFLREMSKYIQYPAAYHPIDYPLYHLSGCDMRPDREEYLRRDLDLFSAWGESHPFRVHLGRAMRGANVKAEITVINRGAKVSTDPSRGVWLDANGEVCFIEQAAYFNRMRAAKCSVSYDGYGSGSFRMTEILVRTLLLQGPLSIVTRAPLIDGETCRAYTVDHAGEVYYGTNLPDVIRRALECPEESFEIYERAYEHCMEHLTERATAQYLLDTVAAHDYSKPTPLELPT
jgi:hypothetical protein